MPYAARVRGYRRHRIKGFVFPAIVPASDADEVPGLVSKCKGPQDAYEIGSLPIEDICWQQLEAVHAMVQVLYDLTDREMQIFDGELCAAHCAL